MKRIAANTVAFSIGIVLLDTWIGTIEIDGNPLLGWDFLATRALSCAAGLFLIKKLGLWQRISLRRDGFLRGILLGLPLLVLGFLSGVLSNAGQLGNYTFLGVPTLLLFTACMLSVGIAEEIVYRGLLLSNMLAKWGEDHRGVLQSILVSAALFGAAHLPNLFFAPALTVIVQAVNAAAGGILFSAIYIRTKNITPLIIVHAATDWLALLLQVCFSGTSVIAAEIALPQAALLIAAGSLPPLFFAWLYLHKKISPPREMHKLKQPLP